jgi:hypothetical protein
VSTGKVLVERKVCKNSMTFLFVILNYA